jgi:formamidopyrimidine-DNA glycosylase
MPELPEVETVCRGLRKKILGHSIVSVEVLRKDSIAYPSVKEFTKLLPGHRIENVRRRGKYILIDLDGGASMMAHLRMSGRFLIVDGEKTKSPDKFLRVRMILDKNRELHFADMRVFGRIWYAPSGVTLEEIAPTLGELGAEPLPALDPKALAELLRKKKQPIKSALLDQRLIAGIGNIYADESLFQSGIHPSRPASSLKQEEIAELSKTVSKVLQEAITLGGSTLRDYTDSEGVNGNYQNESWVYGRFGKACRICSTEIERLKIAGRSSHFCPNCQSRSGRKKNVTKNAIKKGASP